MASALAFCHGPFGRVSLYQINKPLAPHAHREGHLIFQVGHGEAVVSVDGAPHPVDRTRAVAVSPWQPHEFRPQHWGRSSVFLVLYLAPTWFQDVSSGATLHFGEAALEVTPAIDAGVRDVSALLADGLTGQRFSAALRGLSAACFEQSWGRAIPQSAEPDFIASDSDVGLPAAHGVLPARPCSARSLDGPSHSPYPRCGDFRIRKALALMNERVADVCILDRIARDAGLSRPHFYKLFRQNLGLTPNMYLNTLRVERAIRRLTVGTEPITSIGLDLGFASQASFTRFFSNNVGVAPTDYRRASLVAA